MLRFAAVRGVPASVAAGIATLCLAPLAAGSEPVPVPPGAPPIVSNGGFRLGADALWSQGFTGADQRVAILDEGFAGLDTSIAAGELPPRERLVTRSFDAANGLDGIGLAGLRTEHGVRMAEIIRDVAPDAQLILVNYRTQEEFRAAAAWLSTQDVAVINHSNSFLTPPFDGTGPNARAVDAAVAAGVTWVNSVGNFAQRHWSGAVGPDPATLALTVRPGEPLAFGVSRSGPAGGQVELAIEQQDAAGVWRPRATATTAESGASVAPFVADGGQWRAVVRGDGGPPAAVRLFSETVGFGAAAVPDGSIPTPGDAAGALSVAAVPWTGRELAPYSSRGPTQDGRAKPDLAGPTYVTANRAWPGSAGTSAAAAHVTGAVALLRQQRQAAGAPADPATLRATLTASALDLGPAGPDAGFGAGLARVDVTSPRLDVRIGSGPRPLIAVQALDDGTIERVEVTLDGVSLARRPAPRVEVRPPRLVAGPHVLAVEAADMAGNVSRHEQTLGAGS